MGASKVLKIDIWPKEHVPGPPLFLYPFFVVYSTQQLIGYKCSQSILTNGIHNKMSRQCQLFGKM